jgi:hypothetical protein
MMRRVRIRPILARTLLATVLAWPATGLVQPGEGVGFEAGERLPSTIRGELPVAHRTVLGVVVGRDSLADVQELLGPAPRFTPVGSVAVQAVCYQGEDEEGSVVLFQADPKDADARVLMVHATRRSTLGGMARHCQSSPALAGGVGNAAGVTLGMSHDDFIARFLHRPSEDHPRSTGFFFYDLVEPREDAGPRADCQLLSGVRIRTRAGRALAFSVFRFYSGRGC